MKRDLELIKKILLKVEEHDSTSVMQNLNIEDYDQEFVNYQIYLLHQAGLVNAKFVRVGANEIADAEIHEMTWNGHEFLDAARNENIWNKFKTKVLEKGGSIPFSVARELLISISKNEFGL